MYGFILYSPIQSPSFRPYPGIESSFPNNNSNILSIILKQICKIRRFFDVFNLYLKNIFLVVIIYITLVLIVPLRLWYSTQEGSILFSVVIKCLNRFWYVFIIFYWRMNNKYLLFFFPIVFYNAVYLSFDIIIAMR